MGPWRSPRGPTSSDADGRNKRRALASRAAGEDRGSTEQLFCPWGVVNRRPASSSSEDSSGYLTSESEAGGSGSRRSTERLGEKQVSSEDVQGTAHPGFIAHRDVSDFLCYVLRIGTGKWPQRGLNAQESRRKGRTE